MPGTYCYVHPKTNEIIERVCGLGKQPKTITAPDGAKCKRCTPAEYAGQGGLRPSTWPMKSSALAVHPTQRQQYMKFASEHGVPTHFDERGKPEFTGKLHKKKYAELVGATDFDGGYGDANSDGKEY